MRRFPDVLPASLLRGASGPPAALRGASGPPATLRGASGPPAADASLPNGGGVGLAAKTRLGEIDRRSSEVDGTGSGKQVRRGATGVDGRRV